jgi:dynein light intermediate chain 1, cytosolic
MIEADLKM